MAWVSLSRLTLLLALFNTVQACTAITDLDRFKDACEGDITEQRDFTAELHNMAAFVPNNDLSRARIELRVANIDDAENPLLVARAVVEGFNQNFEGDSIKVFMPGAVPPGKFAVHIYVDGNHNNQYDTTELSAVEVTEPSWIANPCPSGTLNFTASSDLQSEIHEPTPTPIGKPFVFNMTGVGEHMQGTQKLELMVFHQDKAVGYYRHADINEQSIQVGIPGIIIQDEPYRIDFYIDKIIDGVYVPGQDHSWRRQYTGGPDGIRETWPHTGIFQDVEF